MFLLSKCERFGKDLLRRWHKIFGSQSKRFGGKKCISTSGIGFFGKPKKDSLIVSNFSALPHLQGDSMNCWSHLYHQLTTTFGEWKTTKPLCLINKATGRSLGQIGISHGDPDETWEKCDQPCEGDFIPLIVDKNVPTHLYSIPVVDGWLIFRFCGVEKGNGFAPTKKMNIRIQIWAHLIYSGIMRVFLAKYARIPETSVD